MYVGQPVPNEWSRPNTTNSGANDDMNNAPSDAVVGIWPRLLGCDVRGDRRKRTILRTFGGARRRRWRSVTRPTNCGVETYAIQRHGHRRRPAVRRTL